MYLCCHECVRAVVAVLRPVIEFDCISVGCQTFISAFLLDQYEMHKYKNITLPPKCRGRAKSLAKGAHIWFVHLGTASKRVR